MSGCTEKQNQKTLEILKKRYRDKYITPLSSFFTRPPRLYDGFQIRLRKQMEAMLKDLDGATICSTCSGSGTVTNKIEHNLSEHESWKQILTSESGDLRAISIDDCSNCFGHGIILPRRIAVGSVFKQEQLYLLKCRFCEFELSDIEYNVFDTDGYYIICKCRNCKLSYSLEPIGFRVSCVKRTEV